MSNKPLTDHCGELMTAGCTSFDRTGDTDFAKGRSALYLRQNRTFRGTENMSKASPASAAAAAATPADSKARFVWEDPLLLEEQLSEEERMVRDAARAYCQDKLMPRILEANRHEIFDRAIMTERGHLGLLSSEGRRIGKEM